MNPASAAARPYGVEIAGTATALPKRILTNADLEGMMDTSDEWIVQRTGIRERHIIDQTNPAERIDALAADAAKGAMAEAGIDHTQVGALAVATVANEMGCPSLACMIMDRLGPTPHGGSGAAFDVTAACSGWVYSLNMVVPMITSGTIEHAIVIGAEHLSRTMRYTTEGRGTAILFGDAAAAAVLRRTSDTTKGPIAHVMRSDGSSWRDLYIPKHMDNYPEGHEASPDKLGLMVMNGRGVFRFAVGTFSDVIAETLEQAGVTANDVSQFICHQSNIRILHAAAERFGIPEDKLYVNIDRYGNTSAASVPICLHELRQAGRIGEGELIMFVAFGGGLTWASSLWQV